MKILYIHIHGTTAVTSFGAGLSRKVLNLFYSSLYSHDPELKLIPLKEAPSACQHFDTLYEEYTQEEDRYYCQWPGLLSELAWQETADFLKAFILQQAEKDDEIQIIMSCHSHGGTVARLTALACQSCSNVRFHIITIATPLSIEPPSIMPDNVITWQHFYHRKDIIAFLGSNIMQAGHPQFTRRIAGIFERRLASDEISLPEAWQSHEINSFTIDPHNNLLNEYFAKEICELVKPVLQKTIHNDASPKLFL